MSSVRNPQRRWNRPRQRQRAAVKTQMESYLQEINQTPLLGVSEERELARRVHAGDLAARDHLIRANLRLVVAVARSLQGHGVPLGDLIAEGNLGLIRAVELFDPERGVRFGTYASYWIKQAIQRGIQSQQHIVRLPAYTYQLLSEWNAAVAKLHQEHGRPPTSEMVGRFLRWTGRRQQIVRQMLQTMRGAFQESDDPGCTLPELCYADADPSASSKSREEAKALRAALSVLDERERLVIRHRFGLDDAEQLTLLAIGERLGLTRERVRQIETEAIEKLRERMGDEVDALRT